MLHHLICCTTVRDAPANVYNWAEEGVRYATHVLRHMHCYNAMYVARALIACKVSLPTEPSKVYSN